MFEALFTSTINFVGFVMFKMGSMQSSGVVYTQR